MEALGFMTALLAGTMQRAELYFRWGGDHDCMTARGKASKCYVRDQKMNESQLHEMNHTVQYCRVVS